MKVLVLSLLRLGDFLQQIPLLDGLAQEGLEVHVLVNENLKAATKLFPWMKAHFFPREALQKNLVQQNCNSMGAFKAVQDLVNQINAEEFGAIENWTHNFLSARLMDLLSAPIKKGARFEEGHLAASNRHQQYLNETWGPSKAASFQWVDVIAHLMGHPEPAIPRAQDRSGPIYLQVLTSDEKKNWSLKNWRALAQALTALKEDVRILASSFEETIIREAGFAQKIEVLNLAELRQALGRAKLLISGDTSVLHLAALGKTRTLALFLGSADPRKTAPRLIGAQILWPQAACSPCRHRDACSQASHLCSEPLTFDFVYQEVMHMIHDDSKAPQEARVLKLEIRPGQSGSAVLIETGKRSMQDWAQAVWDFYLNRDHDDPVAPYATAVRQILSAWGTSKATRDWTEQMKERLDQSFEIIGNISESLWDLMRDFNKTSQISADSEARMREETRRLAAIWRETDFVTRLSELHVSSDANPFVRMRQKKEALQEVFELFSVQKNMIRVLDQELKEQGARHGARS